MSKRYRAGMVGAGNICEFHVAAVMAKPAMATKNAVAYRRKGDPPVE